MCQQMENENLKAAFAEIAYAHFRAIYLRLRAFLYITLFAFQQHTENTNMKKKLRLQTQTKENK